MWQHLRGNKQAFPECKIYCQEALLEQRHKFPYFFALCLDSLLFFPRWLQTFSLFYKHQYVILKLDICNKKTKTKSVKSVITFILYLLSAYWRPPKTCCSIKYWIKIHQWLGIWYYNKSYSIDKSVNLNRLYFAWALHIFLVASLWPLHYFFLEPSPSTLRSAPICLWTTAAGQKKVTSWL